LCPGHNDLLDTDADGIPDGCDECIGLYGSICESGDCLVDNDTIPSGTHAALLRVSSGGTVVGNSDVTFQSTGLIELMPGFKVDNAAVFEAQIVECDNNLSAHQLLEMTANFLPFYETSILSSTQDFRITYEVKNRTSISIEIKDKKGDRVLLALAPTILEIGTYDLKLNKLLDDGVYFIQLHSSAGVIQRKLLVIEGMAKSFSENSVLPGDPIKY
jgi:hypothetical protein